MTKNNNDEGGGTTTTITTNQSETATSSPQEGGRGSTAESKKKDKNKPSSTGEEDSPENSPGGLDEEVGENDNGGHDEEDDKNKDAATDATADSQLEESKQQPRPPQSGPLAIVSNSKKTRPQYKYDPDKITLRFLFANRDGLTVTIECQPADTVGEVKGALLSVWPSDLPDCSGGDRLRLVCMGKGYLMPDARTLDECQIPVFKTHPTPINVSVRPPDHGDDDLNKKKGNEKAAGGSLGGGSSSAPDNSALTSQGCGCTIL